jgi:hypothetical protein
MLLRVFSGQGREASLTAEVKKSKAVTPLPLYDFRVSIEKLHL